MISNLSFNPLELKDIKINLEEIQNELKIFFNGIIQFRDPERKILPYLTRLINYIENKKTKTIIINFNSLTFVNSSGIALLIKWMMDIHQIYIKKNKSTIIIMHDNKIIWQSFVFEVMKIQFPNIILINSDKEN